MIIPSKACNHYLCDGPETASGTGNKVGEAKRVLVTVARDVACGGQQRIRARQARIVLGSN